MYTSTIRKLKSWGGRYQADSYIGVSNPHVADVCFTAKRLYYESDEVMRQLCQKQEVEGIINATSLQYCAY